MTAMKIIEIFGEAGVSIGWILFIAIVAIILPIIWKLLAEAISLRRSAKTDKLEKLLSVLGAEGINSHPLHAELVFRDLFGFRLTYKEITYFIKCNSPLFSITDYKYGRRHLEFHEDVQKIILKCSQHRLNWINWLSTGLLLIIAIILAFAILFTVIALSISAGSEAVMGGIVASLASLVMAWMFLDGIRASTAASRLAGSR